MFLFSDNFIVYKCYTEKPEKPTKTISHLNPPVDQSSHLEPLGEFE